MRSPSGTKDLHRALYEHPATLLQGLASVWQLPLEGAAKEDWVRQLAKEQQRPGRLADVVESLGAEARSLLAEIASAGGLMPAHRLMVDHGALRRLGPAALRREAPWERPKSAVEELYYRGLLYRTYADLGGKHTEALHIPEPLLGLVRDLPLERKRIALDVMDETPDHVVRDDRTAQEDLLALLVDIRNSAPRLPHGDDLVRPLFARLEALRDRGRLLGEKGDLRLGFLTAIAEAAELVGMRGAQVAPSTKARAWLRASPTERYRVLVEAWRRDARWDELRCADLEPLGDESGWDITHARRVVLELLDRAPADAWLCLGSFVGAVKRTRPDLLRPDGDYDAWQLRDRLSGQLVSGYAQWDRIEGSVVSAMIRGPLHWLGIVDLGRDAEGRIISFRVASERTQRWRRSDASRGDETEPRARAEVSEDGRVHIEAQTDCYTRYQLERFATWVGQDKVATFRITEASAAAGYRSGIRTANMIAFLQRVSDDQVPQSLLAKLLAWGGRFGRVWIRPAMVLETVDKATMRELRADPDIKPLLDTRVDDTRSLVHERDAKELDRKLRARGIWLQTSPDTD